MADATGSVRMADNEPSHGRRSRVRGSSFVGVAGVCLARRISHGSDRGYRPAVDVDIASGDVARAIGDDKGPEVGDLVRAAGAVEGDATELAYQFTAGRLVIAAGRRGHGVQHPLRAFGVDESGQHRVDSDSSGA